MNRSQPDAVRVLCFGALRDRLGTEILVRDKVTTVLGLWAIVTRDHPDLREPRGRVRASRNLVYCDWQSPVEPGDEVAFMPPVAGGSVGDEAGPRLQVALVTDPIDVDRLVAKVRDDGAGAIAAFLGTVRNTSQGCPVEMLEYETYLPMAERELRRIAAKVTEHHGLSGIGLVHRTGPLLVGEVSVAVVAAAPHRRAALLACSEAVETIKHDLPIWKREHHPDGARWVGVDDRDSASQPDGLASPSDPEGPAGSRRWMRILSGMTRCLRRSPTSSPTWTPPAPSEWWMSVTGRRHSAPPQPRQWCASATLPRWPS